MREVGRDVDEVSGAGFVDELEAIAPTEAGAASDDVDDGFEVSVMVGAGFGVGVDDDRAGPEFLGSGGGVGDGFGAGHAGSLGSVLVEFSGANYAQGLVGLVGLGVVGSHD